MPPAYSLGFFPLHIALLSVGENVMPIGYWTIISKEPFRFMLSISKVNHTLTLLRKHGEAALHYMPWQERDRVVRAGYLSGRDVNKVAKLGFKLEQAQVLKNTRIVAGADNVFELTVFKELEGVSADHAPFVFDVVAVHERVAPEQREPILFFGQQSFTTVSKDQWRFRR